MSRSRRSTRGQVSLEQVVLVCGVGLAALSSMTLLGGAMEDDIAGTSGGAPAALPAAQAAEGAPTWRPPVPMPPPPGVQEGIAAGALAALESLGGRNGEGDGGEDKAGEGWITRAGKILSEAASNAAARITPTVLRGSDDASCQGLFSLCTLERVGSGLWNWSGASLAWDTTKGLADGAFWRSFENLAEGAGSPLEWFGDAAMDLFSLPLQLGGNALSEAQSLLGRGIKFLGGLVGLVRGDDVPLGPDERALPPLDGEAPTLFRQSPMEAKFGVSDISPRDVDQGSLGSCVALAGFAAIALQNPELIRNAIRDNGDGTYTVTFWKQREPGHFWEPEWTQESVTVNAEVPVDENGNPRFADVNGGELWVAIMEKAWAELHGGYDAINGDFSFGPLEALTGRTSTTNVGLPFAGRASVPALSDLDRMFDKGYAIVAGNGRFGSDAAQKGHQFFVVDVDPSGFVTLGNPWGPGNPDVRISYEEFAQNFAVNYAPTR